ncbi:PREDICTED: E3 ubiquitin-protein ligase RAD18-like [Dufourea novaeangliae]|uniref:E3 ubiquitin-protein ligase RAD18-like n=1 Tax=Dufourea novaeangliae TaxID=178035 RepID=UPI000767731F|nr:PREDICTED: E3 ubiquitin-protein ligase RAD18-like [Dufourea novaeangliae]
MWPSEYIQIKHIEDLLVCGICYEYMETSVITSCSHNYCSLCIRKYLHYKTQCPACFAETFEKDLRKNKVLDEIIAQFLQVKDKLKKCLLGPLQFLPGNTGDGIVSTPKSIRANKKSPTIKRENILVNKNLIPKNTASPSTNVQDDLSSPSTSGKNNIPLMFTPKSGKRPNAINTEDTKVVICPVCKVTVSEVNINRHLDDCLKREARKDHPQIKVESKRQPLPKLVFTLMKDAVMRKKLKEFGLSSQGDRKAMEARLQRYIVLYNAECDKSNPRTVSELVKQCEDEENLEKRMNKTSLFINKLQVNRNTEQNIIDDERKKYLEAHKDSFQSLIEKIKNTTPKKKLSVRRSLINESFEGNKSIANKNEATTKSSDDSVSDVDVDDLPSMNSAVYIQDSDSDTACPLQMYSSTDPKKFLNAELSPSNNNVPNTNGESNYEERVREKVFNTSNHSYIQTGKDDINSDTLSNISVSNREMHSILDTTFGNNMVKNDSKKVCNVSKYQMLLQRKQKLPLNDKMRSMDSVTTSRGDMESNSVSDRDEGKSEKSASVLQDILCDLSSNDSIDSKFNRGKSHLINHGGLNNSLLNLSDLEKENRSSSPECSGSRSFRKRSRDFIQNDNKTSFGMKKKIKKSSQSYLSETDESNEESVTTLNDDEERRLQTKPRLRNRISNTTVTEGTTALRKSARIKIKSFVIKLLTSRHCGQKRLKLGGQSA